jgi:hypothetical protein
LIVALIVVAVLAIVVLSVVSLLRVRWQRKPHLGHWKEWPD